MPSDNEIQWLAINDFSPGIVSRKGVFGNSGTVIAPPGAATVTNTYRCIALPGGGLGPLPKRVRDLSVTGPAAGHTYVVEGFGIFGPLFNTTVAPTLGQGPNFPPLNTLPFEVHLIWGEINTVPEQHVVWYRYRYYYDSLWDVVMDVNLGPVINLFGPAYITSTRMNPSGPEFVGPPEVIVSWSQCADSATTSGGATNAFPNPATPGVTGFQQALAGCGPVLGHQNRVVLLRRGTRLHASGPDYVYAPTNEYIAYTAPNDIALGDGEAVFGQEMPSGYGAWGSLSASDLLLIKHYGGAYLIQGDIANPVVRRLPNVVSTAGSECVGAHSSIGFVYGVNNGGVFVWQGGDGSSSISTQLEDGFWQDTSVRTVFYDGTFLGWGDWILTPNNYLYDTTLKGWWRIDDPSVSRYFIWQRDPMNNVVYGALPSFSTAAPRYASGYDRTIPATNYSWQSHYFFASQGRTVAVRQLLLLAMGPGTVSVTVRSDTGQTNTTIVTLTSGLQYYRRPIAVEGTRHQVQLVADNGSSAAPIIGELQLGWYPAHRLPNA